MKPNARSLNDVKNGNTTKKKKTKVDYKTRHNIGSRQASDRVVTYSESGRSIYDSPIYTDYSEYDIGNLGFKALKSQTTATPLKRGRTGSRSQSPSNKLRKIVVSEDDDKSCKPSKDEGVKSKQNIGHNVSNWKKPAVKRQSNSETASIKTELNSPLKPGKNVRSRSAVKKGCNAEKSPKKKGIKRESQLEDCFKEICKSVIRLAKLDTKKIKSKKESTTKESDSKNGSDCKNNDDAAKKMQAKKLSRKYKNLKPKKSRVKREASLNATAMMNLLYMSPAKTKPSKSRDASPQKRENDNSSNTSNKPRNLNLSTVKVKKENLKNDAKTAAKSPVKRLKPTKTQRLKRSRELKSLLPCGQTIDKHFIKTFDKQPGVWTHERRIASLNAQAILTASKDIDFRREKYLPSTKHPSQIVAKHQREIENKSSANCTCTSSSSSSSSSSSVSTVSREVIEVASENVIQTMHTTVEKSVPDVYKVTKITTKDSIKGHWVTQQVRKNGALVRRGEQNTIKWSNKKLVERSTVTSSSRNTVNDTLKCGVTKSPVVAQQQQQQRETTSLTTETTTNVARVTPCSTVSGSHSSLVNNSTAPNAPPVAPPGLYPYTHGAAATGVVPSETHCQRLTINGMGSIGNYSMQQPSTILTYPRTYQSAFATCNSPYYQHGYFQPAGPMIQTVPESYVVHHPVPIPVSQPDMKIVYHTHANQNIPPAAGIQPQPPQQPTHLMTHQYTSNINQPIQSMVYNPQVEISSNQMYHQNAPGLGQHPGNNYPAPIPPAGECNWGLAPSATAAECNQWQQQANNDCNWSNGGNNEYWQMPAPPSQQQSCNWQEPGNWQLQNSEYGWQQSQPSSQHSNCNWQPDNGQQQAMNCNWSTSSYHQSGNTEVYNSMPAGCMINVSEPAEASAKSMNLSAAVADAKFPKQQNPYQRLQPTCVDDESSDIDIDVVGTDECKIQTCARKQKDSNDSKTSSEAKLEVREPTDTRENIANKTQMKPLRNNEPLKTMTSSAKPMLNSSNIKREVTKKDSLKACSKSVVKCGAVVVELKRTIKKETDDKKSCVAPRKTNKSRTKLFFSSAAKDDDNKTRVKKANNAKKEKTLAKKDTGATKPKHDDGDEKKLLSKLKKTVKSCKNKIAEKKNSLLKTSHNNIKLPLGQKTKTANKSQMRTISSDKSKSKKSAANKVVVRTDGFKSKGNKTEKSSSKSASMKNTCSNHRKLATKKVVGKRVRKKIESICKKNGALANRKTVHAATKKDLISTGKKSGTAAAAASVKKSKLPSMKKVAINGVKKNTSARVKELSNLGKKVELSCWKWLDQPETKTVYPAVDGPPVQKLCYSAIQHTDGDVINVRDCVLIKSGPRKKDLPYIAKITSFWESPEGDMMMSLLWYYRPEHTEAGRLASHMACELFASRHRDENSIACIEDKCFVLTFNQYCRYRAHLKMETDWQRKRLPPVPHPSDMKLSDLPTSSDPQNVFICRRVYDFRQKRILKNPT